MLTRFAMTIWRAMIDAPSYLTDFIKRPTGAALGYLYLLATMLVFFGSLPFAIGTAFIAPEAETFANQQLDVLNRWYPDDLVVTISGGVLSTNSDTPVVLDLPPEWSNDTIDTPAHAIVIDPAGSIDDFKNYETFVLLTDTAGAVRDDDGMLRVFDFSEIQEPLVIDQALVDEAVVALHTFTPALPWIAWALVLSLLTLFPWIIGFFWWLGTLFFLLWGTLLVRACSAMMGRGLTYGPLYRLGAYGVTSSLLLGFAFSMTGIEIPFATYILFFVWMIVVLSRFPRSAVVVMRPPLPPATALKKSAPKRASRAKAPKKRA